MSACCLDEQSRLGRSIVITDAFCALELGANSFGKTYYVGPKERGSSLTFKLYALIGRLELPRAASREEAIRAMKGKVLGMLA